MRIQQLPITVANQIAAGEVIERPASVVKELLENSLDAKANVISIDISYGGLNQVKISDNGIGIVADDLPLAIAAHATSKINQLQDLYSITSMGFRGEALASIASISRLTISSKPAEQEHAMMLSTDGQTINLAPCARSQGTTIDVRDIFFNAPVRKKFLKAERSEFQAIETVVKRFALSAPEIAINLTHNGKQLLCLPAAHCDQSRLLRIRKLLGKSFVDHACYLDIWHSGMRLHGWIGNKDYQSSQNDKQWIYVNSRMVKDKLLNHAIKQAYESLLCPGRYPVCLLYLTINPGEVDVNVHPTKHEVRFQQPRLVHDFISSQIQQALQLPRMMSEYKQVAKGKNLLQVRETLLPSTELVKKTNNTPVPVKIGSWLALNSTFALVFLQEQPYLINVINIQRHWLLSLLNKQTLPLTSRPLLVPISYSINQLSLEVVNLYKQALSQIGIELDVVGEQAMLVRSLPISVPHLAIKQFFDRLFKNPLPSATQLMGLLSECQTFDPQHITEDEKNALITYMRELNSDSDALKHCCKHLSAKLCWDLFNA